MRTISGAQSTILSGTSRSEHVKVEVKDSGGTWRDLSSYPGYDAVDAASWGESSDDSFMTADVTLLGDNGSATVQPLHVSSGGLIDLGREIRISTALLAPLATPSGGDWFVVFHGRIDEFDGMGLRLTARDLAGKLQDMWIEEEYVHGIAPVPVRLFEPSTAYVLNEYVIATDGKRAAAPYYYKVTTAGTTASGDASEPVWPSSSTCTSGSVTFTFQGSLVASASMETVIQSILDGSSAGVTLYTPSSPSVNLKPLQVGRGALLQSIRDIALSIGWDVRYKWRSGTSQFELTLWQPSRTSPSVARTFDHGEYQSIDGLSLSLASIRNVVKVIYSDSADLEADGLTPKRKSYVASDSSSITKYGRRFMELGEAASSPIDTAAEAQKLAEAAVADCCEPKVDHRVTFVHGFVFAELGDYYTFTATGKEYNLDQSLAVYEYRHTAQNGFIRTQLGCRGKPSLGLDIWHSIGGVRNPRDMHRETRFQAPAGTTLAASSIVGGTRLTVTESLARYAIRPEYEWHVGESAGFTPSSGTARGVTATNELSLSTLVPGRTYYAKAVPRMWNASRPLRSLPTTEISFVAGNAKAIHIAPETSAGLFPYNSSFEAMTAGTESPPDHWSVKSGTTWGSSADVYFGTDAEGGNSIVLRATANAGGILSEYFPVQRGGNYNLGLTYKATGSNGGAVMFRAVVYFYKDTAGTASSALASRTHNITNSTLGAWLRASEYSGNYDGSASLNFWVPTDAHFIRIMLEKASAASSWTIEIGNVDYRRWDIPQAPSWNGPSLSNSWANYGSGYANVGYRKDSMGFVHIKGLIKSGTIDSGTTIFTLPSGFRPAENLIFATRMEGPAACEIRVNSSGTVTVGDSGADQTWTSLDGIRFYADGS